MDIGRSIHHADGEENSGQLSATFEFRTPCCDQLEYPFGITRIPLSDITHPFVSDMESKSTIVPGGIVTPFSTIQRETRIDRPHIAPISIDADSARFAPKLISEHSSFLNELRQDIVSKVVR